MDHVLIGPPGIYLIETKAWEGAFTGFKDNWRRKEGGSWVRCESPTKQNQRHRRLFKHWLENTLGDRMSAEIEAWLFPVVLFTRAKWLRVEECSMPVFESGMALAWHIRRQGKNTVLRPEQIDAIAGALVGEVGNFHIRELVVKEYRLIYRVDESQVVILGLVHGKRDLKKLWEREKKRGLRNGKLYRDWPEAA